MPSEPPSYSAAAGDDPIPDLRDPAPHDPFEFIEPWTEWPLHRDRPEGDGSGLSRILVPFNGSTTARSALDVVAELGAIRSCVVWILYVRSWDVERGGGRFCLETAEEARLCAQAAATGLRSRGIATSAIVRNARRERVPQTIVAQAEELCASSVVLGTGARRAWLSTLVGSTSLAVARRTTRPVILVKGPRSRRGFRWGSA